MSSIARLAETHDPIRRGPIEFRYSLGDWCLFRVRFHGGIAPQCFDPAAAPLTLPLDSPDIPRDLDLIVSSGRHIAEPLPALQATSRALIYIRNQTVNYYIDLAGSFDAYLKGFSSKTRSTLQRKVRKIASLADGALECRTFRTPDEVDEFHRL